MNNAATISDDVHDRDIADLLDKAHDVAGFTATYEYPGFIALRHPACLVEVIASSDFQDEETLEIQVQTPDGEICEGIASPSWPRGTRTVEAFRELITPYLVDILAKYPEWLDKPEIGERVRVTETQFGTYLGVLRNEDDRTPYHYFINGEINGVAQTSFGFPAASGFRVTDQRTPTEAILAGLRDASLRVNRDRAHRSVGEQRSILAFALRQCEANPSSSEAAEIVIQARGELNRRIQVAASFDALELT